MASRAPTLAADLSLRGRPAGRSRWSEAFRRFRRHRLAAFGAVVLVFMVAAVLVGPFVYRVPIDEIDFKAKRQGPSWAHPLGTDDLGQALLARILYGGRISLAVGIAAMLIAVTIGVSVGALAGHFGGVTDHTLMRLTDLFLSLPQLPLLLLIIYLFRDLLKKVLGPEVGVFILIVAVIGGLRWMPVARLVRAQFLSLREKEFVEAARGLGAPPLRQVVRHILRSEEHTSELQSPCNLVCRLLLEKKKKLSRMSLHTSSAASRIFLTSSSSSRPKLLCSSD